MTGSLKTLDGTGHTEVEWDTSAPETVAAAMMAFEDAIARGYSAFDTSSPAGGVALREFDPMTTGSVVLVPQLAGG